MINTVVDWLEILSAVLAAMLAASGIAVLALKFLGTNVLGHWLAKALARYTSELETAEHRKRGARARIDKERAETINRVMSRLSRAIILMLYPPQPDPDDERPELVFLKHYRDLQSAANSITFTAVRSGHKFQATEPLLPACLACAKEIHAAADAYFDSLKFPDTHWRLSRQARISILVDLHANMARGESSEQHLLISVCREMYVGAAGT